ncbi:GNAT family N-acetyltransferase [Reinekea marinisedimentorum]|uniref:Acetyltransferase (GNAT) family protein n=1 Tax=Reinekea marinisedimentorum TaxID=230495 RepID=A0A4R3I8C4_9GAMM|nr:GNAT family N-acetyltransferase [Reinekea marinisedimentorum]TCS42071.1 acetyltransferase (GNAT) family protein [Reinekea marinisedimentorum]
MTILQQSVGYPVARLTSQSSKPLALLNAELIQDEGHSNSMTLQQLEERMIDWLDSGQYQCYAIMHRSLPVAYCLCRTEAESLYIRQLFTLRNYRKRGLAKKLLDYVEAHAGPAQILRLEVLATNKAAIKFYQKLGYKLYAHTFEKVVQD